MFDQSLPMQNKTQDLLSSPEMNRTALLEPGCEEGRKEE